MKQPSDPHFKKRILESFALQQVIHAGRTIAVCRGDVVACTADSEKQVALMQATMMCLS